jgi:diketogulonate reductase-like aldo/keto reductase
MDSRPVETALAVGYRHVDTAQASGNDPEVGDGIVGGGARRAQSYPGSFT